MDHRVPQPPASRWLTQVGPLPPPFGGMSVHLLRLVSGLRARGWIVSVLAAARTPPHPSFESRFLGNSAWRHFTWTRRHARGVVHLHDRLSPLTLIAALAARSRGLPLVLTLHGEPFSTLTRRRGLDPFHRLALRHADHVVAVNSHVRDAIAHLVPAARLSTIPAYIAPDPGEASLASPQLQSWLDRESELPLLVALVYRALPPLLAQADVYGLDLLTAACEGLRAGGTPFRLALLLAQAPRGTEERDYFASHEARLRAALGPRFGLFVDEYAPPAIARAAVFLRPTRTDGDAVSVREALALGVPVVASDAAPRPAGVQLHRAGDAESLQQITSSVLAGSAGRRVVEAGDEPGLARLEAVYRSLGARSCPESPAPRAGATSER